VSESPWDALDRLRDVATRGAGERAVLLAAVRWANEDGVLWPAVGTWAALAGVTLQRLLRGMAGRGVVEVLSASPGGPGKTSRYRIPAFMRNPDERSGLEPRQARPTTPTEKAPNPDNGGLQPRQCVRGTTKNNQKNTQQQPAADVLSRMGIQALRDHANATPERVAWIGRVAGTKQSPGGWAAKCIREGWDVPELTPAEALSAKRAEGAALLAEFDRRSAEERARLLTKAREKHPNLAHLKENRDGFIHLRIAAATILAAESKVRQSENGERP
jgi:hypothetical protein